MNIRLSLFLFAGLFFLSQVFAQVPNSSFEQWTNGEPDGWFTNNFPSISIVSVTQSSDAHSGSYSVRGETINSIEGVYPPLIGAGKLGGKGVPISQNYTTINGFYKLSSVLGDKLDVVVGMWGGGNVIAVGALEFPEAAGYTSFSVPMTYVSSNVRADSCLINITIANDTAGHAHVGSVFYVDDISLSGNATSVNDAVNLKTFKLNQNYPNPFNPSTKISWQSPVAGWQSLKVYNILGKEVATLVNGYKPAGNYQVEFNSSIDGKNLSSGVYFYQLRIGSFIQTRKMILTK